MNRHVPVLIVGGGPAGLAAAIEMGERGIDCELVEPRRTVAHSRPRGKTTHARTMEHFRRWGIADQLRALTTTPSATFHDVSFCATLLGHEIHRMPHALGLFPDRRDDMAETGLFVGQPIVEEVLREKVATLPSVRVRYGARATGRLHTHPDHIDIEIDGGDGVLEMVRASYVLAADGPRSSLREASGVPLDGGTSGTESASAMFRAPGLWKRVKHAPAVFYWCLDEGAAGNLSPYDLGRDIWVASWQPAAIGADPVTAVMSMIGEPSPIEILTVDLWHSRSAIAHAYRHGRLFLLGDAARQTPPWGGHGYNTCVQDGVDLAWKLAAVLQGWASEGLLDTYDIERRPIAERVIQTSTHNMRVLSSDLARGGINDDGTRGDQARSNLADELQLVKRPEFYSLGLVLGYSYSHSPTVLMNASTDEGLSPDVSTYRPSFGAGSRLPHAWLPDGRSLYDLLGHGFTVLTRDPSIAEKLASAAGAVPVTVVDITNLTSRFDAPDVVIVRPDQHITWSGSTGQVDAAAIWTTATAHPTEGSRPRP